jgi:hypothetical protein
MALTIGSVHDSTRGGRSRRESRSASCAQLCLHEYKIAPLGICSDNSERL